MKKKILLLTCLFFCFSSTLTAADEEVSNNDDATENPIASEESPALDEEEDFIAAASNLGPTAAGFRGEGNAGPKDEENVEPRVLRDFIESKGLIQCRQKEGLLTIAGDVRARWIAAGEKLDGVKQRGQGANTAINRFKSELNLYLDYVAPRSWVATKVKFVTFDGVDGGTATRTDLERAFIGYDVYGMGDEDFYIEIGRSNIDYLFESKVQFSSIFDGIHFYYTRPWDCWGQFTIHGGPFIVDSYSNHYAWIIETFLNKIRGSGWSVKYSIVDWERFAPTLDYGNLKDAGNVYVSNNPRYRFVVCQWLVGYEQKIEFCKCKTLFIYGAVLENFAAKPTRQTNGKKLSHAAYIGFTLGKLCKACDWSVDVSYQYVQAQAVPEFDLNGIGHGNAANGLLSDAIIANLAPDRVRLFTNFKGWEVNGLYAMTDTLSLRARAQHSTPATKGIGGSFNYKGFEMAVIYAF